MKCKNCHYDNSFPVTGLRLIDSHLFYLQKFVGRIDLLKCNTCSFMDIIVYDQIEKKNKLTGVTIKELIERHLFLYITLLNNEKFSNFKMEWLWFDNLRTLIEQFNSKSYGSEIMTRFVSIEPEYISLIKSNFERLVGWDPTITIPRILGDIYVKIKNQKRHERISNELRKYLGREKSQNEISVISEYKIMFKEFLDLSNDFTFYKKKYLDPEDYENELEYEMFEYLDYIGNKVHSMVKSQSYIHICSEYIEIDFNDFELLIPSIKIDAFIFDIENTDKIKYLQNGNFKIISNVFTSTIEYLQLFSFLDRSGYRISGSFKMQIYNLKISMA